MTTAELKSRLEQELAEDRLFLRKLKPSLILARARGQRTEAVAPKAPQLPPRTAPKQKGPGGGPHPLLVIGMAFATGVALAKWLDWRGHAHPRG
jgi:hypothetical protein